MQNPIPYFGAHTDETVYEYFRYLAAETRLGLALWNNGDHKDSVSRADYAALTRLAGDRILVSNPSEDQWLANVVELGWQVYLASPPAFLLQTAEDRRLQEYTDLAMRGDIARARAISASLDPVRRAYRESRPPGKQQAQFKYWQELLGQVGGPVRRPLLPLTDEEKTVIREAFQACGLGKLSTAATR